jgi:hypothetical protein
MQGRILLLNLDLPLSDILKRKLEHDGFRVTLGSSADQQSQYDLVISGRPDVNHGFLDTPMITLSNDEKLGDAWQLKFPFRPSELLDLAHQRLATAH